ncbi:hypothetical protein HK405_010865 [Cladochytrium tenue]|nr:hypothetical protein HK405_010865 [Cladochytrium tenue]
MPSPTTIRRPLSLLLAAGALSLMLALDAAVRVTALPPYVAVADSGAAAAAAKMLVAMAQPRQDDAASAVDGPTTTDSADNGTYTVVLPTPTPQGDIYYLGGLVMADGIRVYGIFYGNHSSHTMNTIARFVSGFSKSGWWSVLQSYNGSNGYIGSELSWAGTYHDSAYSLGTELSGDYTTNLTRTAISAQGWTPDNNRDIYAIFLASDITETNYGTNCVDYCGYHSGTMDYRHTAIITDATRCPGTLPAPGQSKGTPGCMPLLWRNQTDPAYSVNRDQHADSMITVLAHEISEIATDWDQAWADSQGLECADKCEEYFLDVQNANGTSPYNDAYNLDLGDNGKYL